MEDSRKRLGRDQLSPFRPTVAFVVVVAGEEYAKNYIKYFFRSQLSYCKKNGYQLIVFTEKNFGGSFSAPELSWIKVLAAGMGSFEDFDRVVLIDADIAVRRVAPPIHESTPDLDLLYIADEFQQARDNNVVYFSEEPGLSPASYYQKAGIQIQTDRILNTGLIVFSPSSHQTVFGKAYEQVGGTLLAGRGFHFEQAVLGSCIQREGKYALLAQGWNVLYSIVSAREAHSSVGPAKRFFMSVRYGFMIHFSGATWNTKMNKILIRIIYGNIFGLAFGGSSRAYRRLSLSSRYYLPPAPR